MRVIRLVPKYQANGPPGLDVVSVAICTLLFADVLIEPRKRIPLQHTSTKLNRRCFSVAARRER
jgi:hypothetical protein